MKQWLYSLKPARLEMLAHSTPEEDETVGQHFAYLRNLTERGVMTTTRYPYRVALMRNPNKETA